MNIRSVVKEMLEVLLPAGAMLSVRKLHYLKKIREASPSEEPDLAIAPRLLAAGECAVDAGANYGLYTRFLAGAVGPSGRVFSIEPIPSTFSVLRSNIKGLGLSNVTLINAAVSDEPGEVTMTVPVHGGGRNFYQAHIMKSGGQTSDHTFTVKALPLDSAIPTNARIRLMKVDVEGHELPCMKGAMGLLRRDAPALLIEVSGSPDAPGASADLFALLSGLDYLPYASDGLSLRPRTPGMRSVNYFFLKPDHLARLRSNGVFVHG